MDGLVSGSWMEHWMDVIEEWIEAVSWEEREGRRERKREEGRERWIQDVWMHGLRIGGRK